MLNFLYNTVLGRLILKILTRPFVSKVAGYFLSLRLSVPLIEPFIKKNNISLEDFEISKWRSFNDFFIRGIKIGARPLDENPSSLISPCDGLLKVYDISDKLTFSVKNSLYSIDGLLENSQLAKEFLGGLCLIFRLTPAHYHRYHFFDSGKKGEAVKINGALHTVQPLAVENFPVFLRNSREYTVLDTDNFGKAVFIEVGAMLVGKICNCHTESTFTRGDEKGHFKFGGSTVIVLLKKGTASVLPNIVDVNQQGEEYPVRFGEKIGEKI